MAEYRIDISTDTPWTPWASLASFHGATRKRADAAHLLLQKAIWEALDGLSLRDRPIAHEMMHTAKLCQAKGNPSKPGYFVTVSGAGYSFHLYRVR